VSDDRLTIPHPRWKDRRFVLVPLRELAPELVTTTDIDLAVGGVWPVEPLA
jgi:7,8-dihydro-6-hydroxymethylpterin-pyrophosphokinase